MKMSVAPAYWDPNDRFLIYPTIKSMAREDGTARFRIPMENCDDGAIEGAYIAVQATKVYNPITGQVESMGACHYSDVAVINQFEGAAFVLEIPKFEGDVDSVFEQAVKELFHHTLLGHHEHSEMADIEFIGTKAEGWRIREFTEYYASDSSGGGVKGFGPDEIAAGSIYIYVYIKTDSYDEAMFHIHHVRKMWEQDGSKQGLDRRTNDRGSRTLQNDFEQRLNILGRNPDMGNVLYLRDSSIWREDDTGMWT